MVWDEIDAKRERGRALRLLGPLAPEAIRRAARLERVAEEIGRAATGRGNVAQADAFDPDSGASGRPPALYEHPGGARSARHATAPINRADHWGEKISWNGARLTVEQGKRQGRVYPVPIAPRPGTTQPVSGGGRRGVAEVALFVCGWADSDPSRLREQPAPDRVRHGSLHFLNTQGYAGLVVPEVECAWRPLAEVVQAAGLPFRLYGLVCPRRAAEEIASLLFPPHRRCVKVRH